MLKSSPRTAFTIVELLVVFAILGLFTGLLLPAIMSAREAARRSTCSNNLRQLALGCHEYLMARSTFPPGAASTRPPNQWHLQGLTTRDIQSQGPNWLAKVVPYLEATFSTRRWDATAIGRIAEAAPSIARCPSDSHQSILYKTGNERLGLAKVNYVANFGWGGYSFDGFQDDRTVGAFQLESGVTARAPRHFTDGLSKTVLLSEILTLSDPHDSRGVWISATMGGSAYSARFPPNATVNDRIVHCAAGRALPTNNRLRCVPVPEDSSGNYWATARSGHLTGVVAAMADGSVRFVTDFVDPVVWQHMATRAGGETIEDVGA